MYVYSFIVFVCSSSCFSLTFKQYVTLYSPMSSWVKMYCVLLVLPFALYGVLFIVYVSLCWHNLNWFAAVLMMISVKNLVQRTCKRKYLLLLHAVHMSNYKRKHHLSDQHINSCVLSTVVQQSNWIPSYKHH